MIEERKIADELGYESPIWNTIEETHKSYNYVVSKLIENIGETGLLFMGSHNVETLKMVEGLINN